MGVHTAGEHLAGAWNHGVEGPGQAGDGIEQDHHIAFVLDQTLGFFDDHIRHLHVACRRLVEGRGDHFRAARAYGALHFRDFLGALVDEQHDHVGLGIVGQNRLRDILHHDRLTRLGRSDEQTALSLADGRDEIDDAGGEILGAAIALFEGQALIREQGREVFKEDLASGVFGPAEIDFADLEQGEVAFAVLGRANLAGGGVARAQIEATNLAR